MLILMVLCVSILMVLWVESVDSDGVFRTDGAGCVSIIFFILIVLWVLLLMLCIDSVVCINTDAVGDRY